MAAESLLIPTESDYRDAHDFLDLVDAYQQLEPQLGYKWTFRAVPGFFAQDDPNTNDVSFSYISDFGRLKPWDQIVAELTQLNEQAPDNVAYKLVFCARHGQGFHNVVVEKYGLEAWHEKWHLLETDGEIVWAPDPQLTPRGEAQAKENHDLWQLQLKEGAPVPQKFFVSPLQRLCQTFAITWDGLLDPKTPVVVDELLRETIGINLCDKRSLKSTIHQRFPQFIIDEDVTEEDKAYTDHYRENLCEQSVRLNQFLQKLFDEDVDKSDRLASQVVLTTSHAMTIRSLITVTHHREFVISTGGMIPILIKGVAKPTS